MTEQRRTFTFREKFRYRLDNVLGKGTLGMVGLLAAFTVAFLIVVAVLLTVFRVEDNNEQTLGFVEGFWQAMLRTLDPGTMGADVKWPFRISSLIVTILGIFIVSTLIGILVSGLDSRLAALQRGRGRIAVADHTLVLGWSPKVFTILSELSIANENLRNASVVILADQDKQTMDELIDARLPKEKLGVTTVVTRAGQPYEATDLAIVNPDLAKSIIVLSDESSASDAGVVKTVLALVNETKIGAATPIVAEIASPARAQALRSVTHGRVAVVEPGDVVARTAAQASREGGLNLVFQDLFDFDGDEVYFSEVPETHGLAFGEVLNCFNASAVIGVRTAAGEVLVHPPFDRVIQPGDSVIVISADDSAVKWTGPLAAQAPEPALAPGEDPDRAPETMVIFGWNDYGRAIVSQLDLFVAPGSSLTLVVDPALLPMEQIDPPEDLVNLSVELRLLSETGDPVTTVLTEVDCDHVMILCYRGEDVSEAEAGSRALMTFLEARNFVEESGRTTNVTAELLDERDVELVPAASAAEFVVSERLASLLMSQLSENIELEGVFRYLFDPEGSEIYCKPIERYTRPGVQVSFAEMVEAAKARNEIALGWQVVALKKDRDQALGVFLNPPKSATITFAPGDQLIVLAEEDS